MVALLSWASWAIRSRSLICPEHSERIAHSRSFVPSNFERMSDEWMSEFPTLKKSKVKEYWKSRLCTLLTYSPTLLLNSRIFYSITLKSWLEKR